MPLFEACAVDAMSKTVDGDYAQREDALLAAQRFARQYRLVGWEVLSANADAGEFRLRNPVNQENVHVYVAEVKDANART